MFIFGKLFTTTEAAVVLACLVFIVALAIFIVAHIIINQRKISNKVIYLYSEHKEVKRPEIRR